MKSTLKGFGLIALAATVSLTACNSSSSNSSTADSSASSSTMTDTTHMATATPAAPDTTAKMANNNSAMPAMADSAFVSKAIAMNMAELNAHKAAQTHSMSADVKALAKHMMADHEKLGADMKAYAKKMNYMIPTAPPADKKQMLDDMNASKKGKDWDMAYLDAQENDHNEVISMFQSEQAAAQDPKLKDMVSTAVPQLQMHLKMVQDTKAKMK